MMALEHDLIGLALTNTAPVIVPTNASKLVLGSNPIALAVPAGKAYILEAEEPKFPDAEPYCIEKPDKDCEELLTLCNST